MFRKFKRQRVIICIIIFFILFFLKCETNTSASSSDKSTTKVIKVGLPLQGGLAQKDENGNLSGYTYEYLQEITQYTGWEFEFVEVESNNDSLSKVLEMLTNGEIDIVGGIAKNEETQKLWNFPENGYGYSYTTLSVSEKNSHITEENFQEIKGLRIAVYKNSVKTREKLKSFCEVNNIDYEFVEGEDLKKVIEEGRADVMVGNDLVPDEGFRVIAKFDGNPFYFALSKDREDILSELDSTMLTIEQVKPYFSSYLYNKYFSNGLYKMYLTELEKEYIELTPYIKIVMVDSYAPVQFLDEAGNMRGIALDILKHAEKEIGLKFEYIIADNYYEAIKIFKEEGADAICGIPYDYKLAQEHNIIMSSCFLDAQTAIVTKNEYVEDFSGLKVGVVDRLQKNEYKNYTNIFNFKTIEDCMDAVISGKIDCAFLNLYSAEYMTRYNKYKNLHVISRTGVNSDFCIGIKKTVNTALVSILNKVIYNIPETDFETIIYQNTAIGNQPVTLSILIEENPFLFIGIISFIFIVLGIIGFFTMRFRIKASKRLEIENQRYLQLCELANEYIYEYDYEKDILTFSKGFGKLFSLPNKIHRFSDIISGEISMSGSINPDVFSVFKQMMNSPIEERTEFLCRLPSGEQRWYRSTCADIKDKSGNNIYIIGKFTDVQNEKQQKKKLEDQLLIDGLTGIYNAVASRNIISERLNNLSQYSALLIIDIDLFKEVNDKLGHYMGDLVLKDFACALKEIVGKWDIVGRLGGDEFIIFINSSDGIEKIGEFCEMLCRRVRKTYTNEEGASRKITVSIGAAIVSKSCEFTELYQAVDKELYKSKNQGRDRYTLIEFN